MNIDVCEWLLLVLECSDDLLDLSAQTGARSRETVCYGGRGDVTLRLLSRLWIPWVGESVQDTRSAMKENIIELLNT